MSDVRIILASGQDLRDASDETKQALYAAFVAAYYEALKHDVQTKPDEYAWPAKSDAEIQRVCMRMLQAVYHGNASDSNAMRRAAKKVGLNGSMKYTEALIRQARLTT